VKKHVLYDKRFYNEQKVGSHRSAEVILSLVLNAIKPKSVVDVGCGLGTWLSICHAAGIKDYLGIDSADIPGSMLYIEESHFLQGDLTKPLELGRVFDLALSVEVAEHIPKYYEDVYLDSITRLAPVILFSAAIPYQGGIGHYNEQWQDYWVGQFSKRGFTPIDFIRYKVWDNPDVSWWYSQNCFLFVSNEHLPNLSESLASAVSMMPIRVVHPALYEGVAAPQSMALKRALRALPFGVVRAFKKIVGQKLP
jgi:SAM-dependent methyltransferase